MSDEIAHALFPNDAPSGSSPPAWVQASRATAPDVQKSSEAASSASRVFPSEMASRPAGLLTTKDLEGQQRAGAESEVASLLFPTDTADGDKKAADSFTNMMGDYRLSAIKDGDEARGNELQQASATLLDDVKQSGGLATDLAEALGLVHAGMDRFGAATPEELEASQAKAMDLLTSEYGGDAAKMGADLASARRLIEHVEKKAPGTMASLEYSGAGNDPRLIKLAIKEAKRRGL